MRSVFEFARAFLPKSPAGQLHLEQDILEELQFHLDCRKEANRQCGMSETEAEEAALAQFGDTESVLDACLAARNSHPGRRMARFAARTLPLGLACGAAAAVLLILYALVVRLPATYPPDAHWIVVWWEHAPDGILTAESSVGEYATWRSRTRTTESVAIGTYRRVVSRFKDSSERLLGKYVADDYLQQHEIRPVLGRIFVADAAGLAAKPVVISYDLWQRRYNRDRSVIGTPFDVDGMEYTVVGVTPKGYQTYYPFDFFAPLDLSSIADRSSRRFLVSAKLKSNVTPAEAQREFAGLVRGDDSGNGWHPHIRRPQDVYGGTYPKQFVPFAILTLMLLVIVVARNRHRAGPVRGSKLVSMLIGAGVIAILTSIGTTGLLRDTVLAGADQRFNFGIDGTVAAGFALLVTFMVCASEFRQKRTATAVGDAEPTAMRRISPALILTNALTFLMLVSAVILTHDWWTRRSPDVGFDTENVFVLPILLPKSDFSDRAVRRTFFERAIERIDKIPSIDQYSFAIGFPTFTEATNVAMKLPDPKRTEDSAWVKIATRAVGLDYFDTVGINTLEGHPFRRETDGDRVGLAVVSAAFAQTYWPGEKAIGHRINVSGIDTPFEVTAVVEDAVSSQSGDEHNPMVYPLVWHWSIPQTIVVRTEDDFQVVAQAIRLAISDANPEAHLGEVKPAGAALAASSRTRSLVAAFLWIAALLSLALSSSFTVRAMRRLAERGVRMVTMNRPGAMIRGAAFLPLLFGVAASLAIGALLSKPLSHLLIREMRLDPQVGAVCILVPALLLVGTHLSVALIPYRQLRRVVGTVSSS